ncbi:MAG: TolC family protein [Bdellovibrio sp. CG10_big_fil_rev_8_21_14_0_10_47_8]|nr:MAG: TolC family protein [Bdellovibrio sp. CG10_big_fil_rev_8_21_14_0_10_47_8]
MVRTGIYFFTSLAFLLTTSPGAVAAPVPLTPKDVAELVLKQSYKAQETNLTAQQARLAWATIEKNYDFQLSVESGYQDSKFESTSNSYLLQDKQFVTTTSLKKPFFSGTSLTLEYNRTSDQPDYSSSATSTTSSYTKDIFALSVEQSLLKNFLGLANRAELRSAEATLKATEITRVSDLQKLVLEAIRSYWAAYVAQETFQESLNSRERYQKLVSTVKRKTGYGYASPGESAQAEAELEVREQNVKRESRTYLGAMDSLATLLKLPAGSEVQFKVSESIPTPPNLSSVEVEKLRPVVSSQLKLKAAEENLTASKSNSLPDLSLVGKYSTQGLEETAPDAYNEMVAGTRPQYYVGVKLSYNFGSGYTDEDQLNKRVSRDLADAQLQRQRLELKDQELDLQRKIQSTYAIAVSAKNQKALREKAAQELQKTYTQGRTDISTLIEALNKYFDAEVALTRAIGDYHISLNEWAAFRDELIPDRKNNESKN